MQRDLCRTLNALALAGVCFVLLLAFGIQLGGHELPCPLCLLQRGCYVAVGLGFLFNLQFGISTSHYALILLGAVLGAATSARQILLHIVPGSGHWGSAILGLHLYSWAFLGFVAVILYTAMNLPFVPAARTEEQSKPGKPALSLIINVLIAVFLALLLGELISTFLECGVGPCADNPTAYQLFGG